MNGLMNWSVQGNQLIVDGREVSSRWPIKQALESGARVVVVLAVPPTESMTENVFGVSANGAIEWQIERVPETALAPGNRYMDIRVGDGGTVIAGNWNANDVTIDAATGKALHVEFTK